MIRKNVERKSSQHNRQVQGAAALILLLALTAPIVATRASSSLFYSIAVSPNTATGNPGSVLTTTITVTLDFGTPTLITLSTTDVPACMSIVALTPPSGTPAPTFTSSLELAISRSCQQGGYSITAWATAVGTLQQESASYSITVTTPPPPPPTAPVITSVGSITASAKQTFTITGQGFGTGPTLYHLYDGSVDTVSCNTLTPAILVSDTRTTGSWGAGHKTCNNTDGIGLYLSWTNTQILVTGFGSALGNSYSISPGDPIVIRVWGPNNAGPASFNTIVAGAASPPVITAVTPIFASTKQVITITGTGFGYSPTLYQQPDGSADTVSCGTTTPAILIGDSRAGGSWGAGHKTCGNTDSIGVLIKSWSPTQITLAGFGPMLGNGYTIQVNDPLTITIWGPNNDGQGSHNTVVTVPPVQGSSLIGYSGVRCYADGSCYATEACYANGSCEIGSFDVTGSPSEPCTGLPYAPGTSLWDYLYNILAGLTGFLGGLLTTACT